MRTSLIILAFIVGYNSLFSQSPHLDVEGHMKVRGNIDIHHSSDSTSIYIGRNAGGSSTLNYNTFLGADAGAVTQNSGKSNSFFGEKSGFRNTIGDFNSFFGRHAGFDNVEGSYNSFFGASAGSRNVNGEKNAFFGYDAGYSNEDGNGNAFFGFEAGFNNDSGINNSFFGKDAGFSTTSGSDNAFFGAQAGMNNTTGLENAFFGYQAGKDNIDGEDNTFLGFAAGSKSNGSNNVYVGRAAGTQSTSGDHNAFFGASAGFNNRTGEKNTFIGHSAGESNKFGSHNTYIGDNAGQMNLDSLDRAIAIGYNAQVECNNCAVIGGTGNNSVKVGIGMTNPIQTLDVNGNGRFRNVPTLPPLNTARELYIESDGTLYKSAGPLSDQRLKENFIPLTSVLENIRNIKGYRYTFRNDPLQRTEIGVVAQEIEVNFPELVFTQNEYKGVDYKRLSVILLQAIKEQQEQIELLQKQVQALAVGE